MDTGYTYVAPSGLRAALYAPPSLEVPDTLTLRTQGGDVVRFDRASDRELTCEPVHGTPGTCGACQCGRHPEGVRIQRASPTTGLAS
jgi:hypothetical protein